MNSGGSRKTIASAFANISGTRKQIHPYSASTIYTWNRYRYSADYSSCITEENDNPYNYGISIYVEDSNTTTVYYSSSYSVSSSGLSLDSPSSLTGWDYTGGTSYKGIANAVSGYYWLTDATSVGTYEYIYYSSERINQMPGGYYELDWAGRLCHNGSSPTYTRGSFVSSVTHTSRNWYPDDGVEGSYWYVFVG